MMSTLFAMVAVCGVSAGGFGAMATPEEVALRDAWVKAKVFGAASEVPFSFVYGGKTSGALIPDWTATVFEGGTFAAKCVWTDPATGLDVRMAFATVPDYAVVEWTLRFTNTGTSDTPLIENLRALDTAFSRGEGAEFVLHHFTGSLCTATDFEPFETTLGADADFQPGLGWRRGHRGDWMAGAVGGGVHAGGRSRSARAGWTGNHAFRVASGGVGADAAHCGRVLPRGLDSRTEFVAAVDARAEHATPRRRVATPAHGRVQFALVS